MEFANDPNPWLNLRICKVWSLLGKFTTTIKTKNKKQDHLRINVAPVIKTILLGQHYIQSSWFIGICQTRAHSSSMLSPKRWRLCHRYLFYQLVCNFIKVYILELWNWKVGKSLKIGKIGSDFLSDFLAKMPKCHKMPKCLHFGSGSCIRIS